MNKNQSIIFIAFGAALIVHICNLFIDVMEVDAAQYASIAREMLENNSYLEIYHREKDYLDKPPLLFWISCLSYKLFGIGNFSYKLGSFLSILLAVYSTYKMASLHYNKQTGYLAAFLLLLCQAFFLFTNDVRTDGLLTGFVIFAVWQMSLYLKERTWKALLWASIGIGFGLLSKGPLALIIVGAAIGGDLLLRRSWRQIFDPKWLIALFVIGIILLPMCYGLYQQFDLHPEKKVYGLDGPSGLRFFFWTQSFGRISGEIYWNNNLGFGFFFHTLLWSFLPGVFFLVGGLWDKIYWFWMDKKTSLKKNEFYSFFGLILPFLALSMSNYKLPHYIFPLFPFAAIIAADFVVRVVWDKESILGKVFGKMQVGLLHVYFIVACYLLFFVFSKYYFLWLILFATCFIFFWRMILKNKDRLNRFLIIHLLAVLPFNLFLSLQFYPELLSYQSESTVGKEVQKLDLPKDKFYSYDAYGHSLDFYSRRIVKHTDPEKAAALDPGTYIYTSEKGMKELMATKNYLIANRYSDYHITALKPKFLHKLTRYETLKNYYLLKKTNNKLQ